MNTRAPGLAGTPVVGQTLEVDSGAWEGSAPISLEHGWQRCDATGGACSGIAGQAGRRYTLAAGDVGHTIRAEVSARNGFGAQAVRSAATAPVRAQSELPLGTAPVNTRAPRVTGKAEVGETLIADAGAWEGAEALVFELSWQRCGGAGGCSTIAGATGDRYAAAAADVDHTIRLSVRARNLFGEQTAVSDPTGAVTLPEPVATITYAHDADGRLVGAFDRAGDGVRYDYDANGNLTSVRRLAHDTLEAVAARPLRGSGGTRVTIFGTGFTSNTTVTFDGDSASPSSVGANAIIVAAPDDVRSGPVVVHDGSASAAAGTFTKSPPAPAITTVSPVRVNQGDTLTIAGTGFESTPRDNVVSVGGTRAVVDTATPESLTVTVPPFRPAGRVTVRTVKGTADSSVDVAAAPAPYAAADLDQVERLPVGSQTTLQVGTANKVSLGLIDATAGQRLAVELAGSTFSSCASVKLFAPGSRIVETKSICPGDESATASVVAPSGGTYVLLVAPSPGETGAVTATPRDLGADVTVRAAVDGPQATANTEAGRRAVFLLQAPANRRVRPTIAIEGYARCVALELQTPSGAALYSNDCALGTTALEPITLPVRGDYRLIVTPDGLDAGSVSLAVAAIAADVTGELTLDGPATTLGTSPGQRAAFRFGGDAGARVYPRVDANLDGTCPEVRIRRADGTPMKAPPATDQQGPGCRVDLDRVTLAESGTYTLLVTPDGTASGTVTASVVSVPADATLSTAPDGMPRAVTTGLGQNAIVSFDASSGQRLFITLAGSYFDGACRLSVELNDPSGGQIAGNTCADDLGHLEPSALTDSGTYKLVLDPAAGAAGDTTVTVTQVGDDTTSTTTVDGPVASVTTTPGQNANVTFSGTAGQRVFVRLNHPFDGSMTGELRGPDGEPLGFSTTTDGSGFIDTTPLPADGTYTVRLDPRGAASGESRVAITSVPADALVQTTIGDPAVTVSTTAAGQNGAITFPAAAGQTVRVSVTASDYSEPRQVAIPLRGPDGDLLTFLSADPGNSQDVAVTAAGAHTLDIDPYGPDTGSVTVAVTPAAATPARIASLAAGAPRDWPSARGTPEEAVDGTRLTGTVKTVGGAPLPDVTLRIADVSGRTDQEGHFEMGPLPAGTRSLLIDGRTASHGRIRYGAFRTIVDLRPGHTNRLGFTSYLPALDVAHQISVRMPLDHNLVVRNPEIPGLEVHLPAGATVYDADGVPATEIGITRIPLNRTPVPLPDGVEVPIYYTIQPGGGVIRGGRARIHYPNPKRLPPGARVHSWRNDATDDDRDGWQIYGHSIVDSRGESIVPERYSGVPNFDGAMINIPDQPPSPDPPDPCKAGCGGDPVDFTTGQYVSDEMDLTLPDTMPLRLSRGYSSGDPTDRAFGIGSNDVYSGFISSKTDEFTPDGTYADGSLNLPNGCQIRFGRVSTGTGFSDAVMLASDTTSEYRHAVLAWNGDGFDVAMPDGTVAVHGDHMPLQAIRDRHGNTTNVLRTFETDAGRGSGRVVAVRSPNGRWLRYTYTADGRHVSQISDSAGRTVHYEYDGSGHLTSVTDARGRVTTYEYNAAGRRRAVIDARGATQVTNVYDGDGRVTQQTFPDGSAADFDWTVGASGAIEEARVTNSNGVVSRYDYDNAGYLIKQTDGLGSSLERTTTVVRDPRSHLPAQLTDPLGVVTKFDYDADGNITSVTRAAGTPDAVKSSADYSGTPLQGQAASSTDELGHTTTYEYDDAAGNLTAIVDPLGRRSRANYTADGTLLSTADPGTPEVAFTWDDGLLTRIAAPLHQTANIGYDNADRVVDITDGFAHTRRLRYDDAGQLVESITPLGRSTKSEYDANGNLARLVDPAGHATTYAHDAMNRVTTRTDPRGSVARIDYDDHGRLESVTSPLGQITDFSYDALGRPETVGYGRTGSAPSFTYESTLTYDYDAGDRVRTITDSTPSAGPLAFDYDRLDRVIAETTATGTVGYAYDAAGRRKSMQAPGAPPVEYAYDEAGQLKGLTQGATSAAFQYDAAGRRASETLPGGVTTTYGYDGASRLVSLTHSASAGGAPLEKLTYAHDINGRRTGIGGDSARIVLPAEWSATYDDDDSLTAVGSNSYTNDPDGNRTADSRAQYTWNARGQLTEVREGGEGTALQYDPLGRLLSLTRSGSTTAYRYDGLETLAELTDAGPAAAVRGSYLRDAHLDRALTRTDAAGTKTLLTDALGSTTALVAPDSSNNPSVVTEYSYDPYGNVTSSSTNDPNPVRYTGRDGAPGMPAGLQYNRNRFYDSVTGRFLSRDPLGFAGGDTNLYGYASQNPVDLRDPLGLTSFQNWYQKCLRLEQKINNLRQELIERAKEWQENPQSQPECGPNGQLEPFRSTHGGHAVLIGMYETWLAKAEAQYMDECGGPPPPIPAEAPAPAPQESSGESCSSRDVTTPLKAGAAAAAGTGVIWWLLKLLSPACGPAAPACAIVL